MMRITWVKWEDSSYQGGECAMKELDPGIVVITAGRLVREDDKSISLCLDYYPEDQNYRYTLHILKKLVLARGDIDVTIEGEVGPC